MKVYQAINAVQRALAVDGISKARRNSAQGYNFRGIDDIYNVVSPLLGQHGLCILPRVIRRECTERQTAKGGAMFYVVTEVEFDFVSSEDGSTHIVKTFGEAMDSADKATNKAMSAAYKYALMQAFAIPTEGDNDADAHTPEVTRAPAPEPAKPKPKPVTLTKQQANEVRALVEKVGADESLLLTWIAGRADHPVDTIEQIPVEAYELVIANLKKRAA